MDTQTTPPPLTHFTSAQSSGGGLSLHTSTPASWKTSPLVTRIGPKGDASSAEDIIAMAVGISCAVLFLFICLITVLLWCLSRKNGWYITNEKDEDDEDDNSDEDNNRVSTGTALRSKEEEDD